MARGYDVKQDSRSLCALREMPEENIAAGCLLFSYGTEPESIAICQTGLTEILNSTAAWCMDAIENILRSEGRKDLHYAATHIMDALNRANRQIRDIAHFTGQGLYLGGVVVYTVAKKYILCPFGGGAAYTLDGSALTRQSDSDSPDGLIRDALGSKARWPGRFWQGTLTPGSRFFATSEKLENPTQCAQQLLEAHGHDTHPNTGSMILRRAANAGRGIDAVMEF